MISHKVLLVLTTLTIAAAAPAQLLTFRFTESDVGVYATDGKTPALTFKAKKKLFPNPLRELQAKAPGVVSGVAVREVLSQRGMRLREFCYVDASPTNAKAAGGTTASTSANSITQGVHSYRMNIRGQAKSNLVISAAGTTAGNGKVTYTVDIGANNKIDFTYTANGKASRQVFAITGSNPLPVLVTVNGSASYTSTGSNYDSTLTMWIQKPVRQDCYFSRFGKPCDQRDLLFRDVPTSQVRHVFTATVGNAPANANLLLAVGLPSINLRLPGINCPLLVNPLLILPMRADAQGEATLTQNQNQKLNLTFFAQAAVAAGNTTEMTNGARGDCFDK